MTSELPDQDAPTPADPFEEEALTVKPVALPPAVRDVEDLTWEEVEALSRDAVPTTIRRAPKMSRFFIMGAVVGVVLGLMLGLSSSDPDMNKRGVYLVSIVVFVTTAVELLVGALIVYLDKRSAKAAARARNRN